MPAVPFSTRLKERLYFRHATRVRWKRLLPRWLYNALRVILTPWDALAALRFLADSRLPLSPAERWRLVRRFYRTANHVDCPHDESQIFTVVTAILILPKSVPGVIVEAGCYKGGSTAKLSLAARAAGRELVVFDSFAGLPEVADTQDRSIFGRRVKFAGGDWCGTLAEVQGNVARFGAPEVCRYVAGWFEDTMPHFREPVAAVFVDVDLAASTRTCLKHLYPLLSPGGSLFSHDGHLLPVVEVYADAKLWEQEVGCPQPEIHGLGTAAFLHVVKTARP
ncbi:MAG TPA: TylF/MycF/NovP-related O-methyltransferase [Thermoanaerobaculia bacterium]|nr:TylF/MycF/NovP-related O-methyltransferase [Thermoanaerobaculia bacterium]